MSTALQFTTTVQFPASFAPESARPAVQNFSHFANYASRQTELFWLVATERDQVVGVAPVVRLHKRPATAMLRPEVRRWLGWLGPFARKTTLLVDTAFLAYDDASPFLFSEAADQVAVKSAMIDYLTSQPGADAVWITEPASEAGWGAAAQFHQFYTLPLAHVVTIGHETWNGYLASLAKKRRRNHRHEEVQFASAGATIQLDEGPIEDRPAFVAQLHACLSASSAHSELEVPYNDVLTNRVAFARQRQTILSAQIDGHVIGFISFLQDNGRLLQCHGGLDYDLSHRALAYHNLISAAIREAIARGCERLSMGPLNNETKRRASGEFRPLVANLWNRNALDRKLAETFFARNFAVYGGKFPP